MIERLRVRERQRERERAREREEGRAREESNKDEGKQEEKDSERSRERGRNAERERERVLFILNDIVVGISCCWERLGLKSLDKVRWAACDDQAGEGEANPRGTLVLSSLLSRSPPLSPLSTWLPCMHAAPLNGAWATVHQTPLLCWGAAANNAVDPPSFVVKLFCEIEAVFKWPRRCYETSLKRAFDLDASWALKRGRSPH